jgi:dihydrofolate synthase/folylpolyglutamate synthase
MMNYKQCLNEMYALRRFGIKLGLETIQHILLKLGNPHDKFDTIHVAGTNGKGSVCAMLANLLQIHGFRVGLYTSPHLVHFNERIVINGTPIDNKQVVNLYQKVKKVQKPDRELTFFEYTTAMAFCAFAEQNVDIAVIETGMGGRLDATNVLMPRLSIITNIGLEHQAYLGRKIENIAFEKAGIIKPGVPVITDVQNKTAFEVIFDTAKQKCAPVYQLGKRINVRLRKDSFSYSGLKFEWIRLNCALNGYHQIRNAGMALCAYECFTGNKANWKTVNKALRTVNWPGRVEVISKKPLVILDGAHNTMAMQHLTKYLKNIVKNRSLTLIVSVLNDKPYDIMLNKLIKLASSVVVTQAKIDRSIAPEILRDFIKEKVQDVKIIPNVSDAYFETVRNADESDIICATGSLYVVGEVKAAINDNSSEIFLA